MDKIYTLKTDEGKKNILDFINLYNSQEIDDPLFKKIGFDEGLALTNISEFITTKSQVAEIIREAIEIGMTCNNFKTNTIFTFTRNKLKKCGYNTIIREQIEKYIKFRLHISDKLLNETHETLKFENVTTYKINNETYYYNIKTSEELTKKEINEFLKYQKKLINA